MAQPTITTSFASGEWAPKLRSRVDVQKYHSGAALLRNFYVDFSGGGASTRPGTKYINQCAALGSRLIPFQPGSNLSYVLEFGQNYIRFYSNGATVMSGGVPYQISSPYNSSDLFPNQVTGNPGIKFVQDVTSLIICHPNYPPYILTINSATNWTLTQINFGPTIAAPTSTSASTDLTSGSWNYSYIITAIDNNGQESPPSTPATIGSAAYIGSTQGTNTVTWTGSPGAVSYNVYKALPVFGGAVTGGALFGFAGNVTGTTFQDAYPGIVPDFGQSIPILQNPFSGASVQSLTLTANATYTTVPSVTIAAPSQGVQATAIASLGVATSSINAYSGSGDLIFLSAPSFNPVNYTISFAGGVVITILTAHQNGAWWIIDTYALTSAGSITGVGSSVPSNPVLPSGNNFPFTPTYDSTFGMNLTWHIGALILITGGEGYSTTPSVTISGGATANATLGSASGGNPGVPGFFQQRLVLAAQTKAIQSYNMSQPGSFFNFNVSNPTEDDDAISGSIISDQLNDIRWLRPVPTGLIAGTGKTAWLINGGGGLSTLNPITPSNQTAQPQAFNGANDLAPQQVNFDLIYGTNKGGYFRDLTYNIYANIYTGADITTLSNHLFFGYNFLDIAWSEEPFKTMWVVRNDGILLSLAFVKDQELIGWAHHDTNGQFKSVCSVIETVNGNVVDAVYVIVNRLVNNAFVEYVERFDSRYFTHGYIDAWCVDCGLQTAPNSTPPNTLIVTGNVTAIGNTVILTDATDAPFTSTMATNNWRVDSNDGGVYKITAFTNSGTVTAVVVRPPNYYNHYTNGAFLQPQWAIWEPVTNISGLTQLVGATVTGLADGVVIPAQTVSNTGTITLSTPACKVTVGLTFLPQLKTLPLDLGEPTVQSKRKKLPAATLRCADTLGLQVGTSFANAVTVKDLQLGAIPSQSTGIQKVADLVNGSWADQQNSDYQPIDARVVLDQLWQEVGQLCIQQNLPYPATILGVMPEVVVGDTPR